MLSKRVVLADDNPEILRITSDLLRPEYSIVGMHEDSASLLLDEKCDKAQIAVLDITMGPTNGFELARQIREKNPAVHIVFLTIHEEPEFIEAGLKAGASAYVFKRNLFSDLVKALHAADRNKQFVSSTR